jgi:RND superfamily putative drug exporter
MHAKPNFVARAAEWSATHRKLAIFGWLAFVLVAIAIGSAVGQNKMTQADSYPGESGTAQHALEDSHLVPNTEMVLITGGDRQAAVRDLTAQLEKTQHVREVRSPAAERGDSTLVEYDIAGGLEEAEERVEATEEVVNDVAASHPEVDVVQYGLASANVALSETMEKDLHKAEAISMPLTMIILVIAFGSLVAAGLPLILAFSAVIATMSLVALPSQIFPVNDNVASIILLVGLAVGVDYALFYLRRDREERANGHDAKTSLRIAASTSGHAVLVSGLTVIAAMAGMYLTGDKTFTSLASGSVLVVAVAMVASISVLPAMMSWLGDRMDRGRVRMPRFLTARRERKARERRGFWPVVIDKVMRRPALAAMLAAGSLIALTIPVLGMNTQVTSVNDLPRDLQIMQSYDEIQKAFPSSTAKAQIVVEGENVREGELAAAIGDLAKESEGTRVAVSEDGHTALLDMPISGTGSDEASTAAVEHLRDTAIPATIGHVAGAEANVTGDAAKSLDQDSQLAKSLPIVFAFVIALTFLLMLVTFRSIVIPIGTIVLNMLSVGAAYGVLVLVFQNGLGESLLGFESNGGITSWLPLFLFVILFGLSMDYHVFILSRVREAFKSGMSTDDAVRHGIGSTAGTVTSAAVVMVVVFATFATLSFVDMKQMGVGLAAAVLIDATIIRGVLLPAGMKLLGDKTWWMPRLRRRGGGSVAEPQPAQA